MKYLYKKKVYIALFSIVDLIGNIVFFPVRSLRRDMPRNFKKILVIRLDHIGDIVASTAVIAPLRKAFPDAIIDFLVPKGSIDIVTGDPMLNNVIGFDAPWFSREEMGLISNIKGLFKLISIIKREGYDLAFDLRGDFRHIFALFAARIPERVSYGVTGGDFLLTRKVSYIKELHEKDKNLLLLRKSGIETHDSDINLTVADIDKIAAFQKL